MKSLLSKKLTDNEISIIDELKIAAYCTKDALLFLKKLELEGKKILLVLCYPSEFTDQIRKSFDNLKNVTLTSPSQINVSKILSARHIIFTKGAVTEIEEKVC